MSSQLYYCLEVGHYVALPGWFGLFNFNYVLGVTNSYVRAGILSFEDKGIHHLRIKAFII